MTDASIEVVRTCTGPDRGEVTTLSRSLRVPTELCDDAKRKADEQGVAIDRSITELIEGYVHGVFLLPTSETRTVTKRYPVQPPPHVPQ